MSDTGRAARPLVLARAPGRVVLAGGDADDGLALTCAIDRTLALELDRRGEWMELVSADEPDPAIIPVDVVNAATGRPIWARYVAAVIAELRPPDAGAGFVTTSIPAGEGLGSSTALVAAAALALGFEGSERDLALLCVEAESTATGRAGRLVDAVAVASGVDGAVLLADLGEVSVEAVPMPAGAELVVVPAAGQRDLAGATAGVRVQQCAEAVRRLAGPVARATDDDVAAIDDVLLRRRAAHLVGESRRARAMAAALAAGDVAAAGALLDECHRSAADLLEASSAAAEERVAEVRGARGVLGARLAGLGPGAPVVALAEPGSAAGIPSAIAVRPAGGASVELRV